MPQTNPTETPRQIIGEFLRNSAIGFVLIVGGLCFGEVVAKFLFGPMPGAGAMLCLFIGLAPFISFANRKIPAKITMKEFAVLGVIMTLAQAAIEWFQVNGWQRTLFITSAFAIFVFVRDRLRRTGAVSVDPV